jgi:chromate transporter
VNQIPALIRVFAYLSLLTVGGGMAAFPEMQELTVNVHKWLSFHQLIHLYSVGQLAPGPNMMMIVSIGNWAVIDASPGNWVGGIVGALVVLIAFFGPTAVLALAVGRAWTKLEHWPWRLSIQQGLAPVSIGLLLAGTLSMAKGSVTGWSTGAIALAVLLVMLWRKVNPAILVLGGAVAGAIVFMPK